MGVEELLFEGYEDTVMELGSTFGENTEGDYEDYDMYDYDDDDDDDDDEDEDKSDTVEDDKENVILDKFGWFYKRNGTTWSDGDVEMRTGEGDIDSLGEIVSWNNLTTTDAYDGECSRLRGSTEGLFPPGLADITDSISFFSTDLCRPLHFAKSGSNLLHGIPVTTFELDPDNF